MFVCVEGSPLFGGFGGTASKENHHVAGPRNRHTHIGEGRIGPETLRERRVLDRVSPFFFLEPSIRGNVNGTTRKLQLWTGTSRNPCL